MFAAWVLGAAFAAGAGGSGTTDSGTVVDADTDTDTDSDTDTDTDTDTRAGTADTAALACPDCMGAAAQAGDPGGTPCEEGCSSTADFGPGLAGIVAALAIRRRRS